MCGYYAYHGKEKEEKMKYIMTDIHIEIKEIKEILKKMLEDIKTIENKVPFLSGCVPVCSERLKD